MYFDKPNTTNDPAVDCAYLLVDYTESSDRSVNKFETVAITESRTVRIQDALKINKSETVAVTDTRTVSMPRAVNKFETVAVTDTKTVSVTRNIPTKFETVAFAESRTVTLPDALKISTYDNIGFEDIVDDISIPSAGIEFDAAGPGDSGTIESTISWSHTCTGSDGILIVATFDTGGTDRVTSVKYNSVDLKLFGRSDYSGSFVSELWYLVNPDTGTNTIEVVHSTTPGVLVGTSVSYVGVNTDFPFGYWAKKGGTGEPSLTLSSSSDEVVIDALGSWHPLDPVPDGGQTLRAQKECDTDAYYHVSFSEKPGDTSVTMGWNSLTVWAHTAVALRPTGSGPSEVYLYDVYDSTVVSDVPSASLSDLEISVNDTMQLEDSGSCSLGIVFDAVGPGDFNDDSTTLSWSHTCSGSDRILLVATFDELGSGGRISSVKYNSVDLKRFCRIFNAIASGIWTELWYLENPDTGSNTIDVVFSASVGVKLGISVSYTGVNTDYPFGYWAKGSGQSSEPSLNLSSSSDELVVDALGAGNTLDPVPDGGQTLRAHREGETATAYHISLSEKPGDTSVTMGWNTLAFWIHIAVALRPAGSGPSEVYLYDVYDRVGVSSVLSGKSLSNSEISVNDTTQLEDSGNASIADLGDYEVNVYDETGISDVPDVVISDLEISVNDTTQLEDDGSASVADLGDYEVDVYDEIAVSDIPSASLPDLEVSVNDTTQLEDSDDTSLSDLEASVNDTTQLEDSGSGSLPDLEISVNDSTQLEDSGDAGIEGLEDYEVDVYDETAVDDTTALALSDIEPSTTDSFDLSDYSAASLKVTIDDIVIETGLPEIVAHEDVAIDDSVSVEAEAQPYYDLGVLDSFNISDTPSLEIDLEITTYEEFECSDAASATLPDALEITTYEEFECSDTDSALLPDSLEITTYDEVICSEYVNAYVPEIGVIQLSVDDELGAQDSAFASLDDLALNAYEEAGLEDQTAVELPDALEITTYEVVEFSDTAQASLPDSLEISSYDEIVVEDSGSAQVESAPSRSVDVYDELEIVDSAAAILPDDLEITIYDVVTVAEADPELLVEEEGIRYVNKSETVEFSEYAALDVSDPQVSDIVDSVAFEDSPTVSVESVPTRSVSVYDEVGALDSVNAVLPDALNITTYEEFECSETASASVSVIPVRTVSVVDSFELTDSVVAELEDLEVSVVEEVALSDQCSSATGDLDASVVDSVGAEDSATVDIVLTVSTYDGLEYSDTDSATLPDALVVTVHDDVALEDTGSVFVEAEGTLFTGVVDSVAIEDASTVYIVSLGKIVDPTIVSSSTGRTLEDSSPSRTLSSGTPTRTLEDSSPSRTLGSGTPIRTITSAKYD